MQPSLFEFAGGEPAFQRLATAHHARCLADPELNHPFSKPDGHPLHVERLGCYWAEVLGGPPRFSEQCSDQSSVLRMHAGNGDLQRSRRALRALLRARRWTTLQLPDDPAFREAMNAYMRWAVDTVALAHPDGAAGVAPSAAMPRWGWDGPLR